jgi:signal transduction histidine kinase
MDQIAKERDRLLQRASRALGLSFSVISLLCLLLPGATSPVALAVAVPLYLVLGLAQYRVGATGSAAWIATEYAAGLAILVVIGVAASSASSHAAFHAVVELAAVSMASIGVVLARSVPRIVLLAVAFAVAAGVAVWSTSEEQSPVLTVAMVGMGWILTTVVGAWVSASVPQAARRIASIGRAHRAERQASELEAQRRQGARLLHDTVLATLTLLAHSGVGVNPTALQLQAGDDARLLRQLRLGATPAPQSSGSYNLEPVEETPLGTTLESVKQRFGRMGLEVSWHGTGQVLLPSDVLDAFLLALAECLENVRRHSGVTEAHVTIVDDESTVRAMITDAGVGFALSDVDSARLGFKESVVARLKEVGGNARLFSAPGSGTTVVLEVPR